MNNSHYLSQRLKWQLYDPTATKLFNRVFLYKTDKTFLETDFFSVLDFLYNPSRFKSEIYYKQFNLYQY